PSTPKPAPGSVRQRAPRAAARSRQRLSAPEQAAIEGKPHLGDAARAIGPQADVAPDPRIEPGAVRLGPAGKAQSQKAP
ncbi:hypothetical protein, partial [Hoeflea olei]|uniref:hypothetical protein n=1 Tax=Hoeflea olei TaxID=1480615 RepID=UPI001AECA633